MKKIFQAFLLTTLLMGCQADPIAPMRNELAAPAVRAFPLKRLFLSRNTLFLWKLDGMPADQAGKTVSRVLELASKKTELDDRGEALVEKAKSLNDRDDALKQKRREANLAALKLNQEIKKIDQDVQQLPANDPKIQEMTTLRAQKAAERDQKLADKAAAESEMAPIEAELQPINAEMSQIQSDGAAVVGELVKTVSWYDPQPESITLVPSSSDRIGSVEIRKWGLVEGGRNFTSEGTEIRDLSYQEQGGILRFKVVLNLNDPDAEYYTFDLARSKYGETDRTGKVYFSGDLVRHVRGTDGSDVTTKGAAELSGIEAD